MPKKADDKTRRMTIMLPVPLEDEIRDVAQKTGVKIQILKEMVRASMLADRKPVGQIYQEHINSIFSDLKGTED